MSEASKYIFKTRSIDADTIGFRNIDHAEIEKNAAFSFKGYLVITIRTGLC